MEEEKELKIHIVGYLASTTAWESEPRQWCCVFHIWLNSGLSIQVQTQTTRVPDRGGHHTVIVADA